MTIKILCVCAMVALLLYCWRWAGRYEWQMEREREAVLLFWDRAGFPENEIEWEIYRRYWKGERKIVFQLHKCAAEEMRENMALWNCLYRKFPGMDFYWEEKNDVVPFIAKRGAGENH